MDREVEGGREYTQNEGENLMTRTAWQEDVGGDRSMEVGKEAAVRLNAGGAPMGLDGEERYCGNLNEVKKVMM